MGRATALALALLLPALPARPAEAAGIRMDGEAERRVAADRFHAVLALATETDSLAAAESVVADLARRIRETATPACPRGARVHVEGSAPRSVSFATRPKRLQRRFLLGCATGADPSPADLARMLDAVLALDPGLAVERLGARLSTERDRDLRRELVREAVDDARALARAAAGGAPLRLVGLQSPRDAAWLQRQQRALAYRPGARRSPFAPAVVVSGMGFSGDDAFSTTLHYAARVVVEFEVRPE